MMQTEKKRYESEAAGAIVKEEFGELVHFALWEA
jgi:hypothetical protein